MAVYKEQEESQAEGAPKPSVWLYFYPPDVPCLSTELPYLARLWPACMVITMSVHPHPGSDVTMSVLHPHSPPVWRSHWLWDRKPTLQSAHLQLDMCQHTTVFLLTLKPVVGPETRPSLWFVAAAWHSLALPTTAPQSTVELILGSLPPSQAHAAHALTHAEVPRIEERGCKYLLGTGEQLGLPAQAHKGSSQLRDQPNYLHRISLQDEPK